MISEDTEITDYEEIFETRQTKIFKDSSVLSPDYIPKKLIGRTKEVLELAKVFKPIDYKGYPFNALIFGKTGSGKTVVTKFLLQKLMERLEATPNIMDHHLQCIYISMQADC